jgi:hypothetical protein
MTFGEIDFDGGNVKDVKCDFYVSDLNYISILINEAENGITISVADIQGEMTGQWHYKPLLITYHGKFKATFKTGAIQMHMDIPMHT